LAAFLLGLVFLVIFGIGLYYVNRDISQSVSVTLARSEIRNFLLMAGLYVVNFLTIMMAVLTSVDTLSGEIASGTIHTLVSKPVRRREIVLGKWLGFVGMLTLYLLLMAGGVMGLVYLIAGYTAPNWLSGLVILWLNGVLLLSVSLLGGAMLSTLANGVMVFGLYGVAFIGGWVEQIGSFLKNQTAISIGIISSLIIPSEALWKRVAHDMQSPIVKAMGFSPFSAPSVPSPMMLWYGVFYTLLALALAIRQFEKRDL
jgi:ABC-type transport system involved in multi-copper enzyme maturation permease subunit